jgi:hypothetical protein
MKTENEIDEMLQDIISDLTRTREKISDAEENSTEMSDLRIDEAKLCGQVIALKWFKTC